MSFALFTELCPACRGPTAGGFCRGCRAEFERIADPCPICALPRPVAECPRKQAEWRVGRIVAPYAYAYPLSHYLQALKFKHGRRLGRALGLLLAGAAGSVRRGTLLVPVPLHAQRLRERGYNQALEIAHAVAAELGADTRVAGIARVRAAVAQS
ncbi:MAG TPA: ComF family protein, partial [Gammaproteobacteria bacterium]|nr:ComF family protein [Gammaproteobacteria bacterium]